MARYRIVPERSQVWIDARSSVHPIKTRTEGIEGYVDLELVDDGRLDLSAPAEGRLSLPVERLSSGNRLEDRELRKRLDARRFPTIDGILTDVEAVSDDGCYRVAGDVSFRGVTRRCEDEMTIASVDERTMRLEGESHFDIRDFGMEPPRILMLRVEPEVAVRVELLAEKET